MTTDDYTLDSNFACSFRWGVYVLEQVNTLLGTWFLILTKKMFFFLFNNLHQKQFAFTWQNQQYIFPVLPQVYTTCLALCQNIVHQGLRHFDTPCNVIRDHYFDAYVN